MEGEKDKQQEYLEIYRSIVKKLRDRFKLNLTPEKIQRFRELKKEMEMQMRRKKG